KSPAPLVCVAAVMQAASCSAYGRKSSTVWYGMVVFPPFAMAATMSAAVARRLLASAFCHANPFAACRVPPLYHGPKAVPGTQTQRTCPSMHTTIAQRRADILVLPSFAYRM